MAEDLKTRITMGFRENYQHYTQTYNLAGRANLKKYKQIKDCLLYSPFCIIMVYNSRHRCYQDNPFESIEKLSDFDETVDFPNSRDFRGVEDHSGEYSSIPNFFRQPIAFPEEPNPESENGTPVTPPSRTEDYTPYIWCVDKDNPKDQPVVKQCENDRNKLFWSKEFLFKMPYNMCLYWKGNLIRVHEIGDLEHMKVTFNWVSQIYARQAITDFLSKRTPSSHANMFKIVVNYAGYLLKEAKKVDWPSVFNGNSVSHMMFDHYREKSVENILIVFAYDGQVAAPFPAGNKLFPKGINSWKDSDVAKLWGQKRYATRILAKPKFFKVDLKSKRYQKLIKNQHWNFTCPYNFLIYVDGFLIKTYEIEGEVNEIQGPNYMHKVADLKNLEVCLNDMEKFCEHALKEQINRKVAMQYWRSAVHTKLVGTTGYNPFYRDEFLNVSAVKKPEVPLENQQA